MPWKETGPVEERMKFIAHYLEAEYSMVDLCRYYGISRKTGYKWIRRFIRDGVDGLSEQSRAPYRQARMTAPDIEAAIVALATKSPSKRGPKKLRRLLELSDPSVSWPAVSTIGAILKRNGLVSPRRRHRRCPPYEQPFAGIDRPNDTWSADFKGWFMTRSGERCDPLTISDNYSRYLLRCRLVRSTSFDFVRPIFVSAFEEYGLPRAIRTDNGPPFATLTVGGLSQLSVWWIRLGILPERIQSGKPQQNPRHERMHRTLKADTCTPPRSTWARQQTAFDGFRHEFNHERPHESIDQCFPADLYEPSPRPYPLILPEMAYPDDMEIRSVKHQGDICWNNRHIYLTSVLAGELVGLRQVSDTRWDVYFGPIKLAQLDSISTKLIHLDTMKAKKDDNKEPDSKKVLPM